jgi:hypothetical protein
MTRLAILLLLAGALTLQAQPVVEQPAAFSPSMIGPPEWRFLQEQRVRTELKLLPAQVATVELLAELSNFHFAIRCVSLGCVPSIVIRTELPRARELFIAKTLSNEQRTRLRQIVFQLKEREFGAYAAFAMAARDLGLLPDQLDDVATIKGERVEAIVKLVTSGERFDQVKPKVEAANGDTYEKLTEMLTRNQRERLKELRGKEFLGKFALPAHKESTNRPGYPLKLFGIYDLELRYLAHTDIRDELKLTAVQIADLSTALKSWEERFATTEFDPDSSAIGLHWFTAAAVKNLLDDKQRSRLAEIMMQRRAQASPEAMCGHPAAVEALKLSPIQLQQLKDGKALADVLTQEQVKAADKLTGPPFEVPAGVSDPFLPRKSARPVIWSDAAYARYFLVVSDRLQLDEEQIKKLRDLAEDEPKFFNMIQRELGFAASAPVAGAGRGFTSGGAVAEQYREALGDQCWKVLDEKQKSIARQLFRGPHLYGRRR